MRSEGAATLVPLVIDGNPESRQAADMRDTTQQVSLRSAVRTVRRG